ncbi:MAG: hypothetical protein FJ290_09620 [Planctomycetes bacterium]|nr:hypothetical protein [Planctomycetota bacterium]
MSRRTLVWVLCALGLATEGAELAKLKETLLAEKDEHYGLRVPESDARLKAIRELRKDGSTQAIAVIEEFLTTHGLSRQLKMHALVALGEIGTKEAVEAIGRFEAWSRKRFAEPPPFRFGRHDYAIDHFVPHDLKPLARATDEQGKEWAAFAWKRFGQEDLWLTASLGKGQWAQPILLNLPLPETRDKEPECQLEVKGGSVRVALDGRKLATTLKDLAADADRDGLPDLVEARLGTNLKEADSDGDGVPDGQDPNPLTPKHKGGDDLHEIRQAVFSVLFATSGGQDAIVIVERERPEGADDGDAPPPKEHFASQGYYGHPGFVLRSRQIRHGFVNVTGLAVKVESPTTATATIADWEGNLAASGHEATLKKLHGKWVVVAFHMTWIS